MVLHLFAALVWVGGMFFAYTFLRPAAVEKLEPPERLELWSSVFRRFFPWVWLSVLALPSSGIWLVGELYGDLASSPVTVKAMTTLGPIMGALFAIVFFFPYRHLKTHVANKDYPAAGKNLATIRKIIGFNLILGLTVMTLAGLSR